MAQRAPVGRARGTLEIQTVAPPSVPLVLQSAMNQPARPVAAPGRPVAAPGRPVAAPAAPVPQRLTISQAPAAPAIVPSGAGPIISSPSPLQPVTMAQNEPGALVGVVGGPGALIPAIADSVMNPTNLGIFGALLNRVGMAFDLTRPWLDWPGTVKAAWNMFTKGVFSAIGFEPYKDPQAALMEMYSPIRPATEHVTHRAPRGYVVVEFPPGSGEKVAMKKDIARAMKLYKPQPKALMTVTDVKAVNRANAALKRVQTYAMKKNVVEKCAPAGFGNGIVNKKPRRKTR